MTEKRKLFFWHSAAMARGDPTTYVKLPADLKEKLEDACAGNRRSLTAEIVARLQSSFEQTDMHASANEDIRRYAEANALTMHEALNALVMAAQLQPPVYYVSVDPGASLKDVSAAVRQLRGIAPDDASVVMERKGRTS